MNTSLAALRSRLLSLRAQSSTGSVQNKRLTEILNLALLDVAGDVPEALTPSLEHVVLFPDLASEDTTVGAYLNTTNSGYVLKFTDAAGAALSSWTPDITGVWDRTYHLEILDTSGVYHRRESREFFFDSGNYYVTLDRPWQTLTSEALMTFRLHHPFFYLSAATTKILDPAAIWDDMRQTVWGLNAGNARGMDMTDFRGVARGRPMRLIRGRHEALDTPRRTPTTNVITGTAWQGPLPSGQFSFCYTIVAGKRPPEWQESPGGTPDPLLESAPSPVSAKVDASDGGSILIQTLNLDAMTGYDVTGTLREGHSGYRIRIYVARHSIDTKSGSSAYLPIEASGIYYLLAEIEPTAEGATAVAASFLWRGSVIPDYHRPLHHSTGYYAYTVFPHQDARYELDLHTCQLPRELIDDADTAPIQQDCIQVLLEKALEYACRMDGADEAGAQVHRRQYDAMVRRYRHNHGNDAKVVENMPITGRSFGRRLGRFSMN